MEKRKANMASNIHSHRHLIDVPSWLGVHAEDGVPHLRFSTLTTGRIGTLGLDAANIATLVAWSSRLSVGYNRVLYKNG